MDRMNNRKATFLSLAFLLMLLVPSGMSAAVRKPASSPAKQAVDSLWRNFEPQGSDTVQACIDFYHKMLKYVGKHCKSDKSAIMENHVEAMMHLRNFYQHHYAHPVRKDALQDIMGHIDISSSEFLADLSAAPRIETYFQCWQLIDGADMEKLFNDENGPYRYEVYKAVLQQPSDSVIMAFSPEIVSDFRYYGLTPALKSIKPLLLERFPQGEVKDMLTSWYAKHEKLQPGLPAPDFSLEGDDGLTHRLSDFRGRKVVIDTWATWCHVCVEKLPKYMELVQKYKNRNDVVFLTISVDEDQLTWKNGLKRLNIKGQLNLFAPPKTCSFADDYNARGVPLYIMIDEDGKFIYPSAPGIGHGFEEVLDSVINPYKFTLKGNLTGADDGTLVTLDMIGGVNHVDSAVVSNGAFTIKGSCDSPQMFILQVGDKPNQSKILYLDGTDMTITGDANHVSDCKVEGSEAQRLSELFGQAKNNYDKKHRELAKAYQLANDAGKTKEADKIMNQLLPFVGDSLYVLTRNFVSQHPNNMFSAFVVRNAYQDLYEYADTLYRLLDLTARASVYGRNMANAVKLLKPTAIGSVCPDFTVTDEKGDSVSLQALLGDKLKGHIVVLDFWASWCGPCRKEIPIMKQLWNKYKGKGVSFVSISIDDNRGKWLKAAAEEQLPWTSLWDSGGYNNSKTRPVMGFSQIPCTFVIGRDGRVAAKNLRRIYLQEKLAEMVKQQVK